MSDFVHRLESIKSGTGDLFIGPANTIIPDLSTSNRTQLKHVGSIASGGFDFEFRNEDFPHETGRPVAIYFPMIRGLKR